MRCLLPFVRETFWIVHQAMPFEKIATVQRSATSSIRASSSQSRVRKNLNDEQAQACTVCYTHLHSTLESIAAERPPEETHALANVFPQSWHGNGLSCVSRSRMSFFVTNYASDIGMNSRERICLVK